MAARAILLDLDGTVWDSYPLYAELLAGGRTGTADEVLERLRLGENVFRLVKEAGISSATFKARCVDAAHRLIVFGGVHDTLASLGDSGVKLGVVTSLPGSLALPMLEAQGFPQLLKFTIHAGNCRARKPQPGPLLAACRGMGIEASSEVYYAGDQQTDAQAASNAGLSFAWASYGYGSSEPDSTDVVLQRFTDLRSL